MVQLHDEVGVGIETAGVLERRDGDDRRVRRGQRQVEKKRLARLRLFRLRLHVCNRLVEQMRQHFGNLKVRADRPLAIPTVTILCLADPFDAIRRGGDLARIDPDVRRHVQRPAVRVVLVKAVDVGAVRHRLGEVDLVARLGPVPTEVPLADHRGVVTGLMHQVGKRRSIGGDQMRTRPAQHAPRQPRPPVVSPGQQPVTGRRANGTRRVGVEKRQPFVGQLLQSWRLDFAIWIGRRDVPNPQVVGHHEDHVRLGPPRLILTKPRQQRANKGRLRRCI